MKHIRNWWPILLGSVCVLAGVLGIWRCPDSFGLRMSEALFIAGFLSLTVDLFLKTKLQRDTANDIFHHLLGMNLPVEIRESLKETIQSNKQYRKNLEIDARAHRTGNGVTLEVSIRASVVAVVRGEYRQSLQFEDCERPNVLEVSLSSITRHKLGYNLHNVPVQPNKDEPEVLEWKGKEITLARGEEIHTFSRFTVERALHDFWVVNFGNPVIHARVRVYGDDELKVTASWADQIKENEYFYEKVFVTGDHLQIRWKPRVP